MSGANTIAAGDIFDATKWSDGALPSRMDLGNMNAQAVTISKAMTNAVTSANIDLNGYVNITSAGSIDCHGANLTMEDDENIAGNITNCGTLRVEPSTSGGTSSFVVGVGVTIGAATVVVVPYAGTVFVRVDVPLAAVQVVPQGSNRATLAANLACASLSVTGILWGDNNTASAAFGATVSGAIVNSGTMNLLTSIAAASITNTGTISNSTIALNGGTIINTGGTISGCTITGGGTIIGGTVTGCAFGTGPVKLFGVTDGGGNSGTYLTFPPTTALEAQVCRQNEEGNA
jgi:hypothetical protein